MYSVDYLSIPQTLTEALSCLEQHPNARALAGGTDVVVRMRSKKEAHMELVSLSRLEELKGIRQRGDGCIEIGAMSTFTELACSEVIAKEVPMLKTAALAMGGPQIQNVATVGGNICNGATSADSAPPLLALGAVLVLQSAAGGRSVPLAEFYAGPGSVKLQPGELLVRIEIPAPRAGRRGDCYLKFSTRKAMDLALVGCACVCALAEDGAIADASIAFGVAAPTPIRAHEAERYLTGRYPTPEVLAEAGELALKAARPRDSWRASKAYREQLIRVLIRDAVTTAYKNAGGECTCAPSV